MINIRPLKGETDQWIEETLEGIPVSIRIKWNERFQFFSLSLYNRQQQAIIEGVKLLRDTQLLTRFNLNDVTGALYCLRMYGDREKPSFYSFPDEFSLFYLDRDDMIYLNGGADNANV